MSLQDQLLALSGRRSKPLEYHGTTVYVREFSLGERHEYFKRLTTDHDSAVAHLLRCTVCDEQGDPALTEEAALTIAKGGGSLPQAIIDALGSLYVEGEEKKD